MSDSEDPREVEVARVGAEHRYTFCIVARLESVSVTTASLGRSQPAVSRQPRILEEASGLPLYKRIGTGVALQSIAASDIRSGTLVAI